MPPLHCEDRVGLDLIGVPGGFSYGDYLRCGAMAARSPVMREVVRRAEAGVAVLGVCNGFQILTEAGLLPGALIRNADLRFVCRFVELEVATRSAPSPAGYGDAPIRLPVAHHDGNYVIDPKGCSASRARTASPSATATTRTARPPTSPASWAAQAQRPGPDAAPRARDRAAARRQRRPAAVPLPARGPGMSDAAVTPEIVAEHGLKPDEYERILEILGRAPNLVELGIFSVMWSEHCSYKSSKIHLGKFPTKAPWVVCGPGENAGVVDIGDGPGRHLQDGEPQPPVLHRALPGCGDRRRRHPARRVHHGRPARGAARRAALRRPLAPQDPPPARRRRRRASAATATASACPPWAASARSTAPTTATSWSTPCASASRGPTGCSTPRPAASGNPVVYVGAKTGRDGIHGATMASAEFSDETEAKRPDRPGRRPVHREAADRGLPRADGPRLHRRHPGHGGGRPHLLLVRDGRPGRGRHRARSRPGAAARDRHDALRDHALGEPGAHAHGARGRPRGRGTGDLRQVGPRLRRDRPGDRHRPHGPALAG